eukprot:UN04399
MMMMMMMIMVKNSRNGFKIFLFFSLFYCVKLQTNKLYKVYYFHTPCISFIIIIIIIFFFFFFFQSPPNIYIHLSFS